MLRVHRPSVRSFIVGIKEGTSNERYWIHSVFNEIHKWKKFWIVRGETNCSRTLSVTCGWASKYETTVCVHVITVYGKNWYIAPRILNLDDVWLRVISFTLQLLLSPYLLNRRLGGPQSLSGGCGTRKVYCFAGNLAKITLLSSPRSDHYIDHATPETWVQRCLIIC